MRLFVALDIDADIRAGSPSSATRCGPSRRMSLGGAGDISRHSAVSGRNRRSWMRSSSALRQVKGPPIRLTFRNAGFFPNPKIAARVLGRASRRTRHFRNWSNPIGDGAAASGIRARRWPVQAASDAGTRGQRTAASGSGRTLCTGTAAVRAKVETLPPLEFGTMTAREFYLYESKLSPTGAQYTKLARYPLE